MKICQTIHGHDIRARHDGKNEEGKAKGEIWFVNSRRASKALTAWVMLVVQCTVGIVM